jgi:hypothetical protein
MASARRGEDETCLPRGLRRAHERIDASSDHPLQITAEP